jgi:predicted Zn-dependent protease
MNRLKPRTLAYILGALALVAIIIACNRDDPSINIFTVDQDIEFGQNLDDQILGSPGDYPILDRAEYPDAYDHLERILDNILASGELKYADRFDWEVKIINDSILNAFAAPGGYMYFYSGIIKFLDNEAQFAGVMAHEMAHCDRRHSTDNLTKQYGFSIMVNMALGKDPGQLAQIAAGMAQGLTILAFTRKNEYEADEYAVRFLNSTDYHPPALGGFFEKLESMVTSSYTPAFLKTHPSPEDRLEQINAHWEELGSKQGETYEERYQEFKNSLPG